MKLGRSLPIDVLKMIEKYDKIYLWFDNDERFVIFLFLVEKVILLLY
jgi:hypothetical protein